MRLNIRSTVLAISMASVALSGPKAQAQWAAFSRANCAFQNESITIGASWFTGQMSTVYAHSIHGGSVSDEVADGPNTIIRARAGHWHMSGVEVYGGHVIDFGDGIYISTGSVAEDCNLGAPC